MICQSENSAAQISSATSDAVKMLSYTSYEETDPLFVFYQSNESYVPGELTASFTPETDLTFIWTKYDAEAQGFTIPVLEETNATTSTISELDEGGYRVEISNGVDLDTSFIAWVMLDNLIVRIVKDEDDQIPFSSSGCNEVNWILLIGEIVNDTSFFYYDPLTHDTIPYYNNYDMEWTSDNPDLIIPNRTNKNAVEGNYSESPPYIDTYYILTVTDSLGMTEVDSAFYDSKFTRAEFSVEYYDKITEEWSSDLSTEWNADKGSLDAPLDVRFINESENGDTYTWVFVDTTDRESGVQTLFELDTSDFDFQPEFTYYTADEYYYPYLVSFSDQNCPDTFFYEDGIQVIAAQLLIPNVFSPNGDGTNDYFIFKHQSIKEFKITISDRFGRIVYREKVDNIYEWEGWRGTVLNSDRAAPEGQYFYVIEGLGYDHQEFRDLNIVEQRIHQRETGGGGLFGGRGSSQTDPQNGGANESTSNIYTGWLYLFRGKGEF
ncbi:gliding motility-associated C-terminal domain-containing protein [Bacteroidota bacterium]